MTNLASLMESDNRSNLSMFNQMLEKSWNNTLNKYTGRKYRKNIEESNAKYHGFIGYHEQKDKRKVNINADDVIEEYKVNIPAYCFK